MSRPRRGDGATEPRPSGWRHFAVRHLNKFKVFVVLMTLPLLAHVLVLSCTRMTPPVVQVPNAQPAPADDDPARRVLLGSYARKRGKIREVRLVGDAATSGYAQVRLLYDAQIAIEREMHEQFAHYVPWALGRLLIVDMARVRFRQLDRAMGERYRREIAAQALAFSPDPFTGLMGTYQRFVFLHSLYDIMLSFERSPLVGCSSIVLGPELTAGGRTLLARNFDFEGPQVLDDEKAVFLVLEPGRIAYATVSWPGFVGAATGMNAAGLAIVVHGARAGEPRPEGAPVAQTVRELLASAQSVPKALSLLPSYPAMVSHMLLMADASGAAVVVERVPGEPPFVRRHQRGTLPLTNHFEGPHASNAKNLEVMRVTSTVPRRKRLDEIAQNLRPGLSVQHAVDILRDKRGAGAIELPLGHRSAIDALIATHSVVMDTTARKLWVSEGPHAAGRFVRFDLAQLLAADYVPKGPVELHQLPADSILSDGRYRAWQRGGSSHRGAE